MLSSYLFHLQFLLSFVLRHVADHNLLARFQAADDLDVVVVALAEADLAGMEHVAIEDKEGVVAGATVEGAVADAEDVVLDAGDDEDLGAEAGTEAWVRHIIGHDGEGDGTALAQGRDGVDDAREALLADTHTDRTAYIVKQLMQLLSTGISRTEREVTYVAQRLPPEPAAEKGVI